eukprot:4786603-Amphidinium_carterae.1
MTAALADTYLQHHTSYTAHRSVEMVDYGYPQTTNTEHLKSCIHNEAGRMPIEVLVIQKLTVPTITIT